MNKTAKRIIGIAVIFILWAFYILEEEFAFYGIYTVINYNIHEVCAIIPYICILVTFIWIAATIVAIIKDKLKNKKEILFILLLIIIFGLNIGYFSSLSQYSTTTATVTVESVNSQEGTITVKPANTGENENYSIVLDAPDLFMNLVETGDKEYQVTYRHKTNEYDSGKLSEIHLFNQ